MRKLLFVSLVLVLSVFYGNVLTAEDKTTNNDETVDVVLECKTFEGKRVVYSEWKVDEDILGVGLQRINFTRDKNKQQGLGRGYLVPYVEVTQFKLENLEALDSNFPKNELEGSETKLLFSYDESGISGVRYGGVPGFVVSHSKNNTHSWLLSLDPLFFDRLFSFEWEGSSLSRGLSKLA